MRSQSLQIVSSGSVDQEVGERGGGGDGARVMMGV